MKGDFSRVTFDPTRHFSQVLMQQGRVLLADDLNEGSDIFTYLLRTFIRDVIGPYAGPPGNDAGFKIGKLTEDRTDFEISSGRYYVDGILCENEPAVSDERKPVLTTFLKQPHFPRPEGKPISVDGPALVYLDVWERHVSAVELDDIREKALGGPDTATRAQVIWQIRIAQPPPDMPDILAKRPTVSKDFADWWTDYTRAWQPDNRGRIRVAIGPGSTAYKDPCIQRPQSGYRGTENHLYRIEIHNGGSLNKNLNMLPDKMTNIPPTFKWSRENGSVVTSWLDTDGKDLIVTSARGFARGDWVELLDDSQELQGRPGTLYQLDQAGGGCITLSTTDGSFPSRPADALHPRVRRWDQKFTRASKRTQGDVPIVEASDKDEQWIDLEDGLKVWFLSAPGTAQTGTAQDTAFNFYRSGDYWLLPERVISGGVDLPGAVREKDGMWISEPVLPRGITHHYAPLAFFPKGGAPVDLRRLISFSQVLLAQ
jgi:hypothetical protein